MESGDLDAEGKSLAIREMNTVGLKTPKHILRALCKSFHRDGLGVLKVAAN